MNYDRIMNYARDNQAIIPAQGSQCHTLLAALFDGEKLTVAEALSKYGCYALSQRMGDLSRQGWPIKARPVKLPNGKRIKEYSL